MIAPATFDGTTLTYPSWSAHPATITAKSIERCFDALTHFPERRAKIELECLSCRLNSFAEHVGAMAADNDVGRDFDAKWQVEQFTFRHVQLTRHFWNSEARCLSAFVVGPANFPAAANNKRLDAADRRRLALTEHSTRALRVVRRLAFPHGHPSHAIRGNHPFALELLNRKIARLRHTQALWKAINLAHGAWQRDPESTRTRTLMGLLPASAQRTVVCYVPKYSWEPHPIAPYQLTNLNAQIKQAEARAHDVAARRAAGSSERACCGVRVLEDADADRLRLIFPGKPDEAVRSELKARGFRWSPSEGAWQRHLNNAARHAAECVLAKLEAV